MSTQVQTRTRGTTQPSVILMQAGLLQRKCACGQHTIAGEECEECRQKREGMMQRAAVSSAPENTVLPVVNEVLGLPGQPLDIATRGFMEPRFGYDFSQVRVHTDAKAAESARAVNALAYTVGHSVVFGTGQYATTTIAGKRLLAHELTHVVQQQGTGDSGRVQHKLEISEPGDAGEREAERNTLLMEMDAPLTFAARSPMLARAQDTTTVEVIPPTGPNACVLEHHQKIFPAATQAQTWLDQTLSKLGAYVAAPNAGSNKAVRDALNRHFQLTEVSRAQYVLGRLNKIKADISSRTEFNVECHNDKDRTCGAAGAYVINNQNLLVFCPKFFTGSELWRAETIIHEMAHALVGGDFITDRGYAQDRVYPLLSTDEALTNAESYGLFVQELGTNRVPDMPSPKDTHMEDCPDDWKDPIKIAIARAQRWNRDAQFLLRDRRPQMLDEWVLVRTQYLGETTTAVLDAAQKVYDKVAEELLSSIDFECEPKGGGRCDEGAHVYWYGVLSDFHICPAWKALDRSEQITFMLAGLYGYLADVDDQTRRLNYARLAKALNLLPEPKPRRDIGKEPDVPVFED